MKKLILFLCIPLFAPGQKKDTLRYFFDDSFSPTTKDKAVYYGISIQEADHWFLYAVYPDNTPVLRAYYKDKKLKQKDGPYTLYYTGRKTAIACNYRNNKKSGLWLSWYENGQLKDSCMLMDDQIVGEYRKWFASGQLNLVCNYAKSTDVQTSLPLTINDITNLELKDGLFQNWYENGHKESEGNFRNNQMTGVWHFYYENGKQSTTERYSEGKLVDLTCYDSTGKEAGEFCSISKPATVKGIGDYRQYIADNLLWPAEALKKGITGTVKVKLRVSKSGELVQLELQSTEAVLKGAVDDLFSGFKEWYPAISHNRPVVWQDEFEVPFYRD